MVEIVAILKRSGPLARCVLRLQTNVYIPIPRVWVSPTQRWMPMNCSVQHGKWRRPLYYSRQPSNQPVCVKYRGISITETARLHVSCLVRGTKPCALPGKLFKLNPGSNNYQVCNASSYEMAYLNEPSSECYNKSAT